jgi:hypothetical protein
MFRCSKDNYYTFTSLKVDRATHKHDEEVVTNEILRAPVML